MEDTQNCNETQSVKSLDALDSKCNKIILSYLSDPEIWQVIQSNRNMYDVGRELCKDEYFEKGYQTMKFKKRRQEIDQLTDEQISNKFNFVKEYGDVVTRTVKTVNANIKLDPTEGQRWLEEAKVGKIDSLQGKGVFSMHCGGFANAAQWFDGTAFVTLDHELESCFKEVINESINYIPEGSCVIQIDCGSADIVYISADDENENFGTVYSITKNEEDEINDSININLPDKAKWVCASVFRQFAATIDDRVYCWLPHADCKPFEIKGLFNDDNEYDEDGAIIEEDTKTDENSEDDEEKLTEEQKEIRAEVQEIDRQFRAKIKEESKNKVIKKIVWGNHFLLVLYKSGELFIVKFDEGNKEELTATRISEFRNKQIVEIEASYTHWIAFENTEIKPITEWNVMETADWIKTVGFRKWSDLVKYHDIDGKTLYNADTELMEDQLEIYDPMYHKKLRYEINQMTHPKFTPILYGWGSNHFGQLGLPEKSYTSPTQIPLPPLSYKDDYKNLHRSKFACGRRNTALLTKKGELWIWGNFRNEPSKKPKKETRKPSNDEEEMEFKPSKSKKGKQSRQEKHGKHAKQGKKGKKKTSEGYLKEIINIVHEEEQPDYQEDRYKHKKGKNQKRGKKGKHYHEEEKELEDAKSAPDHWFINFTELFNQDSRIPLKIRSISLGVLSFAVVLSTAHELPMKVDHKGKKDLSKKKMRTLDTILKHLKKNTESDELSSFSVVYIDRFKGHLEIPLQKFLEESEIPQHRVEKLRKDTEIVWDKVERIDTLHI